MTFERPQGLLLLALALPLVALHMRWRKRRTVAVPSLALWTGLGGAGVARRGFRRVEDAVQLALLLAALAGFALGFAGPVTGGAAPPPQRLAIVIDGSASANARADDGRRRFDPLRDAAAAAIARLAPTDEVVVWIASDRPRVAVDPTSDGARALRELAAAEPTLDDPDVAGTAALARKALRGAGAVLVLADAANADGLAGLAALPGSPVSAGFVSGGATRNAGIDGVSFEGDEFVVHVRGDVAGRIVRVSRSEVAAPASFDALAEGPADGAGLRFPRWNARMDTIARFELLPHDAFPQDDVCDLRVAAPRRLRAAVVSPDGRVSPFLATALRAIPELVDAERSVLAGADAPASRWADVDLVVALGDVPDSVPPDCAVLRFDAPGSRVAAQPRIWPVGAHPVTDGVPLETLRVAAAAVLDPLPAETVLAECADGPVAACGERAGRRTVRFGFRADETTFAMEAAFPLLVRNAVRWLARPPLLPAQVLSRRPIPLHEPVPPGADRVWIEGPGAAPRRPLAVLAPRWLDEPPHPSPAGLSGGGAPALIRITGIPGDHATVVRWAPPDGFRLDPADGLPSPVRTAADAAASLPDRSPLRDTRRRWARECALAAAAALAAGALAMGARRPAAAARTHPPAPS